MTKRWKHRDCFQQLEKLAPKHLAYEWDNIGLQIGNKNDETRGILVTLDVTEAVVDEAIKADQNLIIAHHPLLFQSLKNIDLASVKGKLIEKIIKHNITVYAAHTNLDIASGGVNDMLCSKLGIEETKPLIPTHHKKLYKLIVFAPKASKQAILHAIGDAGAGNIGHYSHCAFYSDGSGTFKAGKNASPFVGEQNKQHVEAEVRLEVIVPEERMNQVRQAMLDAHPYEEPAYDIILLENKSEKLGLGRIGKVTKTISIKQLCDKIKDTFELSHVRVSGTLEKDIKKIAILGGSGEKFVQAAIDAKADVYITGDMTFHPAQDAELAGMTVIDAGHIIEKVMIKDTAIYLQACIPQMQVSQSNINTDPFQYY